MELIISKKESQNGISAKKNFEKPDFLSLKLMQTEGQTP